jgi:DNA helicase IV
MEYFEKRQGAEINLRRQEVVKRAIVGVIMYRLLEQMAELKNNQEGGKENPQDLLREIANIFDKSPEEFRDLDLDEVLQKVSEHFANKERLQDFLEESEQNKKQILKDLLQIDVPK